MTEQQPLKECPHCHVEQTWDNFSGRYNGKPHGWCRACRRERAREDRLKKGVAPKKMSVIVDGEKLCVKCDVMQPLENFSKTSRGLGGVAAYCKPCMASYARAGDKEAVRQRTAKYRIKNRARYLANHRLAMYKYRTLREVTADGTVTDDFLNAVYATSECFYCKCETPEKERTADHVVPLAKGGTHSASNIVMACFKCNSSKRDVDADEFLERLIQDAIEQTSKG